MLAQGRRQHGCSGAFAPVNFQQGVHCIRPDEELSYMRPYFTPKLSFLSPKRSLVVQKLWYNFEFLGCGITPLALKKIMHPSFRPCCLKFIIAHEDNHHREKVDGVLAWLQLTKMERQRRSPSHQAKVYFSQEKPKMKGILPF